MDNYVPAAYKQFYDRKEQGIVVDYVIIMGYDEHYVRAITAQGILTVEGEMLHMQSLDLQKGEMQISGKIGALAYSDAVPKGEGGFFARLFR